MTGRRRPLPPLAAVLLLFLLPLLAAAEDRGSVAEPASSERTVVTEASLALGEETLSYRTTAGFLPIGEDPERPRARMFFVAYERLDAGDPATRPITFLFNGGPGAASVFLHLGAAGPRRLAVPESGELPVPPTGLEDNGATWLRFTDLVFVDPVGTGYSRTVDAKEDGKAKEKTGDEDSFFEVEGDLDSIGRFIRLFLTRFDRWASPRVVAGESYGGFRAAVLPRRLLERFDIALNGAVLVSPALEFALLRGGERYNLLPWVTLAPSLAVTAGYHGRGRLAGIGEDPGPRVAEIEAFVLDRLLPGLARLGRMEPAERDALFAAYADYLGLPDDLVARKRGRIDRRSFAKKLLASEGRIAGLYDGRQSVADPLPDSPAYRGDPSFLRVAAPFAEAFLRYLRQEVGFRTDRRYRVLARELAHRWDYGKVLDGGQGFVGASDDLAFALTTMPGFRVLLAHGYHDLVTPWFASRYLVDQMPLPPEARRRLRLLTLPGGHMFYLRDASRRALSEVLAGFYADLTD